MRKKSEHRGQDETRIIFQVTVDDKNWVILSWITSEILVGGFTQVTKVTKHEWWEGTAKPYLGIRMNRRRPTWRIDESKREEWFFHRNVGQQAPGCHRSAMDR